MKDELSGLFRERFAGHEAPVDAGLWDAIQSQLGAVTGAAGEEGLRDLFQERFSGHEVPVDPGVWAGISSQIGQGVAATSAGSVALGPLGWAAAGIGVVAVAGAAYLFTSTESPSTQVVEPRLEQAAPAPEEVPAATATPFVTEESRSVSVVPGSIAPAEAPVPAPVTAPKPTVLPATQPPLPKTLPAGPEQVRTEAQGAVIVENIISELTTRVTEEVLAEAAQRNPLANPPSARPSALPPEEVAAKEEEALPELFLHNTFTPNGDGVNDTYSAVINPEAFERVMMRIYDVRNNRLVFSTNTNEPWTGDGCLDGYYLVAVEAITPDGRLMTQGKVVWLNRNTVH